jgi:hypothetical protein
LQRIEKCRSFRELQTTFERQQQRLRTHHLAGKCLLTVLWPVCCLQGVFCWGRSVLWSGCE